MDVESLYTNIDIQEGLDAIKRIFLKYPDSRRPDQELLQLLEINLRRNDFEFNGEFFLQIKGTAMGKKFAPAYANIFMAEWETTAMTKCDKKPSAYYRFLDDVWGVWPHGGQEFEHFLTTLNSHNQSIKLKATTSSESVDFLDTTTFKGKDFSSSYTLDVKDFFKPTDTHALLHKTSFHPKHTFAGIIKSQLLRFHRICTQQSDFQEAKKILFSTLSTRGYCRTFLRKVNRTFLEDKPIKVTSQLPLVMPYSPHMLGYIRGVKENFQTLVQTTKMLTDHEVLAAYRRNKNLKDYLVKAKLRPTIRTKSKDLGQFFKHKQWIYNVFSDTVYLTRTKGTARTSNCVYLITCKTCQKMYVGETKNTLLVKFTQHRYNILRRKGTNTHLVQHFLIHGWQSVTATVLESNSDWTSQQRKWAERLWIMRLDTAHPGGLNEAKPRAVSSS
uniref:Reverse transcriptase domain-containing protein n=1 Tax=Nothobranchius furzeri TaxID=105023 RepID=A0A1A8V751_NOTFU